MIGHNRTINSSERFTFALQANHRSVFPFLNPLSLTPSRLPRFSANENRSFPHAFSRQKSKNRGESDISEMKLSDFPCFSSNFLGKKTVWWRVARKTSSQTRLERETPLDAIDEGNDSKT